MTSTMKFYIKKGEKNEISTVKNDNLMILITLTEIQIKSIMEGKIVGLKCS